MKRTWSLRNILTIAVAAMAVIALAVASALVVLTTQIQRAADGLGAALQSVLVAEEAALNLLLHSRARDPLTLTRTRADVEEQLRHADAFVSTPTEEAALRTARQAVERYFAAPQASDATGGELQTAYAALEKFVDINVSQAGVAQRQADERSALGNRIGFGAAVALAALVLILVAWLRRRAFAPVFALSDAMMRFSSGQLDARAPERGPAELRHMAEQFNAMAHSLARQRENRVALMAGVAHDLRNPLSALKLSVSMLTGKRALPHEEQIRSLAARLHRQIGGLDRMVGDFLDMARIEAGQLELNSAECDVRELAHTVVELFRPMSPLHELELIAPREPVTAWCDNVRMEQVLNNLVTNAIKYSPAGGTVVIRVASDEAYARISVRDRGIGIDPADIDVIFDPFRRAEHSTRAIPGVGLGLYVARLIVEAHGGRIEVSSSRAAGSEFTVILPLRSVPGTAEADPARTHSQTAGVNVLSRSGARETRADEIRNSVRLLGFGIVWMLGADAALACSCDPISPSAGLERAQYVFTGKVVRAEHHTWLVAVDRVWKGKGKLAGTVKLMDVYAAMECEFFFELGRSYLFFAILAKGGRDVFYHPQVCNWTRPLRSSRVVTKDNESLWVEDFIVQEHGPGEPPPDKRH